MSKPSETQSIDWQEQLLRLGAAVRRRVLAARDAGDDLAAPVAQEGGDTIFAIDRHVEPAIEREIESWPDACKPLAMVAEGFGIDGRKTFGDEDAPPRFHLIVDPIDGTRNIMYDKRPAYFIAALCKAATTGRAPTLADTIAAVIVELPTSKQGAADAFFAAAGQPAIAQRMDLGTGEVRQLPMRPSQAPSLLHGFGQVANFFPGTKVLAAELMERIVHATLGDVQPGQASVFDDQFITTAGQMVELMIGHDRFCCDLRPLFYRILEKQTGQAVRGLECHPYDLAGMLVAQQAGVVLTDGFGQPLDAPLDVHHPVHWCGYANETLRQAIEPVIQSWLREKDI